MHKCKFNKWHYFSPYFLRILAGCFACELRITCTEVIDKLISSYIETCDSTDD